VGLFIVTGPARLDRPRWTLRAAATEAAICDRTRSGSETGGAPDPPSLCVRSDDGPACCGRS